jgi:hypothetical protein
MADLYLPRLKVKVAQITGLGTISTQASNNVSITGGSVSGITDITVADGGTGRSTLTSNGLIYGLGASAVGMLAEATDGQLPIGDTSGPPVLATLSAGGGIGITNAAGSITVGLGPIQVITQAATDTLSAAECYQTIVSNYGQSGANTQTLPAAASGLSFLAVIGTAGQGAFNVKAGTGDKIYLDGTALDDGDKVALATPAVGNCASFFTFQTGASAWDWYCITLSGTWTDGGS